MKQGTRGKRSESGFSLIELLVVVAIIVIISAMAAPNIIRVIRVAKLRSQAAGITSLFERARQVAVRTDTGVAVKRDAANAQLLFIDNNGTANAGTNNNDAWDAGEAVVILDGSVNITGAPPATLPVPTNTIFENPKPVGTGATVQTLAQFNGLGLPCASNGTSCKNITGAGIAGFDMYITDGQYFAAVSVAGNGRVRTFVWTGAAWSGK